MNYGVLVFVMLLVIPISLPGAITWETKTPMPTARSFLGIVAIDECIYAIGGRDGNGTLATVEVYDTTTNGWTSGASMPGPRREFGIGAVQGKLYVVGGYDGSNILSSVLEYDPAGDTWTSKSPLSAAREGLSVAVANDTLYAIGGDDGSVTVGTVEAYDPVADVWTSRAAMPTARTLLTCQELGGKIYAMGGNDVGVNATGVLEVYDPVGNSWSTKTSLMPRYGLSSAVVDDRIYAFGGFIGTAAVGVVQSYDTTLNSWSAEASLPTARWALGSGAISNSMYVVGGQTLYHGGYVPVNEVATVEETGIGMTGFVASGCCGSVRLWWRVESEGSIMMYLLRRQHDGDPFVEIARIAGSGSSPSLRTYSFEDKDVAPGVRYSYKLGIVEEDGNTTWFGPVSAAPYEVDGELSVTPNLMQGKSVIRYSATVPGYVSLVILDVSGKKVRRLFEGEAIPGHYTITWNGEDDRGLSLSRGIYFCVLTTGTSVATEKVLLIN